VTSLFPLWDSQAGYWVRDSVRRAKAESEGERMLDAERRLEILQDDWKDILLQKLYEIYRSPRIRERLPGIVSTEHNVFKRIVTELSTVYKWGATREVAKAGDQELADQLWTEARIDSVLERANLYCNGLRDLFICPRVVDGQLRYDLFLPDRTSVIQHPDDPTKAVGLITERTLANTPGYTRVERLYADAEVWRRYNDDGSVSEWAHGLGRLPAVAIHAEEPTEAFWNGSIGSDIVDATLSVGADLVKLSRLLQFQSELQVAYQGNPRDVAKALPLGAEGLWAAKGLFNVLNLQADPSHIITTIKARLGWIATQHGLAADVYDLSTTASSGLQLRLKRAPLEQARVRQIKSWRAVEKELLLLTAQVTQRDHPLLKLDPLVEYKLLDFHEEPMLEDPMTQNRVWQERIDMGLTSQPRVLREMHPDLSKEESMELAKEIASERGIWAEVVRALQIKSGGDPGPSAQQNGRAGAQAKGKGRRADEMKALASKAVDRFNQTGAA
jgi:hypothetical protein